MRDLWGVTIGLLISLLFMASLFKLANGAHQNTIQSGVAGQALILERAAAKYVENYQAQLLAATSATTPAIITVPMLEATKSLTEPAQTTDIYGQTWEVAVLQPTSGELQAFVTTTGRPLSNLVAVNIAQQIGVDGGFYPQSSSVYPAGTIMGMGGNWQKPVGNWPIAQGELAVYVDTSGDTSADYLYRNAVPGDLQANTMNAPLIMSAVETVGASCASSGAIAQDGSGSLLSCQSGTWQAVGGGQWKPPVATYGALPGSGNTPGDVRLATDTDRAFAWNGGSWVALAVDQNGNLTVPNSETVGGTGSFAHNIGTAGYSPTAGLPPGWGGGVQTWDVAAHGTIGVGPNNSSPNAFMNSAGTIGNQGVCIDNNAGTCQGWGVNTRYTNGWGMVATDGAGNLNVAPGSALGSANVNDIDVRAGGAYPWYSELSAQVYSNTQQLSQQGNEISTLNNEYSGQQTQITSINSNLNQSNCDATSYSSITNLCNEYTSLSNSVGGLGNELPGGSGIAIPRQVTSTSWGCVASWRGRCYQYGWVTSTNWQSPTLTVSATNGYAVVVSIQGSAGYIDGGPSESRSPYYCTIGSWSTPPAVYLTYRDSSGAQQQSALDESVGAYADGVMFPVAGTFTVPAGRVATLTLSGGSDHLGCGSFSYQLTKD